MNDAPDVIYLQWIPGCPKDYFEEEVTWCTDEINDDDVKYLKADSPHVIMPLDLLKQIYDWELGKSYDDPDMPKHMFEQIKILIAGHQIHEWVNKKRLDAGEMAYRDLVDHHAEHHRDGVSSVSQTILENYLEYRGWSPVDLDDDKLVEAIKEHLERWKHDIESFSAERD